MLCIVVFPIITPWLQVRLLAPALRTSSPPSTRSCESVVPARPRNQGESGLSTTMIIGCWFALEGMRQPLRECVLVRRVDSCGSAGDQIPQRSHSRRGKLRETERARIECGRPTAQPQLFGRFLLVVVVCICRGFLCALPIRSSCGGSMRSGPAPPAANHAAANAFRGDEPTSHADCSTAGEPAAGRWAVKLRMLLTLLFANVTLVPACR